MKKLSYMQRLAIAEGIRQQKSNAQIAREIGVHRSTVGREIERNASSREEYAALDANDKSWRRQQAAVPQRMMLFGGVDFFTKLQQHDKVYIYYSRTHRNRLSRIPVRDKRVPLSYDKNFMYDVRSMRYDILTSSENSLNPTVFVYCFTFQKHPVIIFNKNSETGLFHFTHGQKYFQANHL